MIQNQRQYNVTKRQIVKLGDALAAARQAQAKMPPHIHEAMVAGIKSQIRELRKELRSYDNLRKAEVLRLHSITDLPQVLIQARIARGYTQEELARKLAVKPQQIQRYEKAGYQSVSFRRLVLIARTLDIDFEAAVPLKRRSAVGEDSKPSAA